MVKVKKTWDSKCCIKNTRVAQHYICNCPACEREAAEQLQRAIEQHAQRLQRLMANLKQFWTDEYSSTDKLMVRDVLQAGYEVEP